MGYVSLTVEREELMCLCVSRLLTGGMQLSKKVSHDACKDA